MTQKNNDFIEKTNEILAPFEDEVQSTILMSSLMGVFASDGIKDIETARMSIMQEILNQFNSLTYTNLVTIYTLSSQLDKNYASTKNRKNNQANEKIFYTKEEMQKIASESYNKGIQDGSNNKETKNDVLSTRNKEKLVESALKKGVIEGRKELLSEIKKGDYPKLIEKLCKKKFEEGYEKANEDYRTIGFQTAYQRGYEKGIAEKGGTVITSPMQLSRKNDYEKGFKEGFEKGKELRIKELKKMRGWE